MVSDTLCDRELASLSSLSRNNLFLISPCFGGKQLHSKLKPLLFYSQTLSLFQQQLSLKQHKIPLQPGSYYFSTTVLGHGLALWLHYTGHILRFLTQQQALFLGFIPDLLLGGPIAPPKPLQPFLFIFFCLKDFYFNHAVPIPRTIRGQYSPVYRKCRATECCFGKLQ